MIAASAVLVVVAFVALIIGIFQTDGLGLIWVSITSSVLAALFLLLGVVKARPPKIAGAPGAAPGSWGDAPTVEPIVDTGISSGEPAASTMVLDEPVPAREIEQEAPAARRPVAPARPASRPAAASRSAASARSASARTATAASKARTPAGQVQVVVIPDRDKFHKSTCRYAKTSGTMKMAKTEARREGYKACGVCKP